MNTQSTNINLPSENPWKIDSPPVTQLVEENPNGNSSNISPEHIVPVPRLTPQEIDRLKRVRLELLKGAIMGGAFGAALGGSAYMIAQRISSIKPYLPKRYGFPAVVGVTGSVFAYLFAVSKGKNAFAEVADIVKKNATVIATYQGNIRKVEQEIVNNLDDSFHRRAEAIRKAKEEK